VIHSLKEREREFKGLDVPRGKVGPFLNDRSAIYPPGPPVNRQWEPNQGKDCCCDGSTEI